MSVSLNANEFEDYKNSCAGGDANACCQLGSMYDYGLHVEQDYSKARELYTKACNAGNAAGCHYLGSLFDLGNGINKDEAIAWLFYDQAINLYMNACNTGDAKSCYGLAELYSLLFSDPLLHIKFFNKSCDGGHSDGCHELGNIYATGKVVKQDKSKAMKFYAKACKNGNRKSCKKYFDLSTGDIDNHQKACDGGDSMECMTLGYFYARGIGVKKDESKAMNLYKKACNGGITMVCNIKVHKKKLAVNTIESIDLLKIFALDKSVNHNMYSWETGTEESSPIIWLHGGIKPTTRKDYPYERRGEVYVLNQGKITHKILNSNIENGKWQVTLLGARGGYFNVEIDSGFISYEPAILAIDKKYIIEENHCSESASESTSMYLIQFKGKKAFWLKESFSAGSAGSSYSYIMMYEQKPKCMY